MRPADEASRVKSGDEHDVTSGWRRYCCWTQRAGACAKVKRGIRRRSRRAASRIFYFEELSLDGDDNFTTSIEEDTLEGIEFFFWAATERREMLVTFADVVITHTRATPAGADHETTHRKEARSEV
jgi:hypothetical protein